MNKARKTTRLQGLVATSLFLLGMGYATARVQAAPRMTMPATADAHTITTSQSATLAATTTFTATDFDSTIFILAPAVRSEQFDTCVDNPYYPLLPGTTYVYRAKTDEGVEEDTFTVTDQTKVVMGITAIVVHDTARLNGEVVEETFDWFAQDKRGNVWYLGEETQKYENGAAVSSAGSWEAGVNGAQPGIIMLGQPLVGDLYRQEYLVNEAVDMAAVLSLSETVTNTAGIFDDVLMTADHNPLDGSLEHKFYAPSMGLIREEKVGDGQIVELISVTHDPALSNSNAACDVKESQGTLQEQETEAEESEDNAAAADTKRNETDDEADEATEDEATEDETDAAETAAPETAPTTATTSNNAAALLTKAKLLIEHNATDKDTGFQGFADGDPWNELTISGPDGEEILTVEPEGELHNFGLTELFFETAEPPNTEVPIDDVLTRLAEGQYTFTGAMVNGDESTRTVTFSHKIPAGPVLKTPADGATGVDPNQVVIAWEKVTTDIHGAAINIVGYQVIVEKDEEPQYPQGFAQALFSIYLPATVTNITVPQEFVERDAPYKYEVLAIEESGNQTLAAATFRTK